MFLAKPKQVFVGGYYIGIRSLKVKTNNNFNFFPSKLHRLILEFNYSSYAVNLCFGRDPSRPLLFVLFRWMIPVIYVILFRSSGFQAICKIVVTKKNLPQIRAEHLKKILNTKPPLETICLAYLKNIFPQATSNKPSIFAEPHEDTRIWTWLDLRSPDGIYRTRFHFLRESLNHQSIHV